MKGIDIYRTVCWEVYRPEKENGDKSENYTVIENTEKSDRELYCNRKHRNKGDCPWLKVVTSICLWHSKKSK